MQLLNRTLDDPGANLALDEALLEEAEQQGPDVELLRLWEFQQPVVVLGRSSRLTDETHLDTCQQDRVAVLRRCSGGAAIVAGPGCFMYSLVLSYERRPQLRMIDQAHQHVLGLVAQSLQSLDIKLTLAGTSDLAWNNKKCSGNSVRCKRTHLLYHGTLLYDFSLPLISRYLASPPRQPDYREGRDHDGFLTNLPLSKEELQAALCQAWQPVSKQESWPEEQTEKLLQSRYSQDSWNHRF